MISTVLKQRYSMQLSYHGARYHGWQVQPNAVTVQEKISIALKTILREEINLVGCGRTDTGVHARNFFAHFEVNKAILDSHQLCYRLNQFLPRDIFIKNISHVSPSFHARFDATLRTYKYYITSKKNPFVIDTAYLFSPRLDIQAMNEAAKVLCSYTDFTSFSKLHTQTNNNFCDIYVAKWECVDDMLVFTITANRFLRNMVRAIVGTLLEVGMGKIGIDDFHQIINKKDRSVAGFSVPAHALFLHDVIYDQQEKEDC